MSRPRAIGLAGVLAFAGALAVRLAGDVPRTHEVEIRALTFRPLVVRFAAGDTVVWRNRDLVPHTVTSPDGTWDSGELAPGEAFRRVIERAESVTYSCRYHPGMAARLEPAEER